MPWISAKVTDSTEVNNLVTLQATFTDAAEFPATDPFMFAKERVLRTNNGELAAFKTEANAALGVERTKRQNRASREATFLNFLNT